MTVKKNILFISSLFPSSLEPTLATFNRQQMEALSEYFTVDVVAPISWNRRLKTRNFIRHCDYDLFSVYYPTYWNIPRVLRHLNGQLFWLSIFTIVQKMIKQKNYFAIYSSWLFPDSWAAAKVAQSLNLPLFVKVHGTDVNSLIEGTKITQMSLDIIAQAKKTFCVSHALKNRLVDLGAESHSLEVIYNGVNKDIFKPENINSTLDEKKNTFLYVGNLKITKGLGELVESFSSLVKKYHEKNFRLVIIGDGPYKAELLCKILNCNVSNQVKLLGSLSPEKVSCWMNNSDCLCLPSYMEGVPNVVLEALSCKLPVVATNVGGIPELAKRSSGVILVKAKSADSLFEGLERSLTKSEAATLPRFIGSWQQNARTIAEIINS